MTVSAHLYAVSIVDCANFSSAACAILIIEMGWPLQPDCAWQEHGACRSRGPCVESLEMLHPGLGNRQDVDSTTNESKRRDRTCSTQRATRLATDLRGGS